jgi:hypothetical protein
MVGRARGWAKVQPCAQRTIGATMVYILWLTPPTPWARIAGLGHIRGKTPRGATGPLWRFVRKPTGWQRKRVSRAWVRRCNGLG